jgi:tetratricopeptide (TPR) repeat protein
LGEQQQRVLSAEEREADLALLSLSEASQPVVAGQSSSAKVVGPGADQAAPRDMLEYARSLRASGDFRRAVEVYRKIHAANPASPSGRAALVSLGELLLTLHDPQGALNAFDSYLAGGGALAQEASYGRARALRALNRPAEERRAIERFLAAHPEAPQSRVLRARLAAIQK